MQNSIQRPGRLQNRSRGLKFIAICGLVMLMSIPAMFISYMSFERSSRADEVTQEVALRYGGEQLILGPTLVVPYFTANSKNEILEAGDYVIYAEEGNAVFEDITTTLRTRSLFKVPTYQGRANISASFKAVDKDQYKGERTLIWDMARIMVGVSDGRGLTEDIYLTLPGGERRRFEPAAYDRAQGFNSESHRLHEKFRRQAPFMGQGGMTYLSVPADALLAMESGFQVKTSIQLGGAVQLGMLPFAKSTRLSIAADWPDPGFVGGFPPTERDITATGFRARWSVPYLARGVLGEGPAQSVSLHDAARTAMSVHFVAQVNPYQTVNRALKYSVMFIGLVFIAYFLFEVLVGVRVHPAQYILIGLAQSIFYLLLLAIAEQVGFGWAFLLAASATIAVTAAYAGAVFGDRKYMWRSGAVFVATYGLLYTLMRLQDFALMIGALASFMAIALIMYFTRNMDWYAARNKESAG